MAKYDVAIIGSGPGGYVAAIRAGELGLKTVVVEKDPYLGGTCLHVGCIPTKVLLHHADVYDHFKNAAELGFEVSGLKINWANVLARKDKIVKKHAKGIEFLFKKEQGGIGAGLGTLRRARAHQRGEGRQEDADRGVEYFDGQRVGSAGAAGHRAGSQNDFDQSIDPGAAGHSRRR